MDANVLIEYQRGGVCWGLGEPHSIPNSPYLPKAPEATPSQESSSHAHPVTAGHGEVSASLLLPGPAAAQLPGDLQTVPTAPHLLFPGLTARSLMPFLTLPACCLRIWYNLSLFHSVILA